LEKTFPQTDETNKTFKKALPQNEDIDNKLPNISPPINKNIV